MAHNFFWSVTVLAKTKSRSLFKKFCLSVGKAVLRQCWMACNKSEEVDTAASASAGAVPSGYISRTQPTSSSSCRLLLYSSASGSKYSNRMDDRNDVEVTIDVEVIIDGDVDSDGNSDKDCCFAFSFIVLIDDDDDDDEVENASQNERTDPKNGGVVSIVVIKEKHNDRNTIPSNCTAIIAVIVIVVVLVFVDLLFETFLHDLAFAC